MSSITSASAPDDLLPVPFRVGHLDAVFATLPGYHSDLDESAAAPASPSAERSYIGWRPGDDHLSGRNAPFSALMEWPSWDEFCSEGLRRADVDLNLVADFFFELTHDGLDCGECAGGGLNPATRELHDSWSGTPAAPGWFCELTQAELDHLVSEGRLSPSDFSDSLTLELLNDTARARLTGAPRSEHSWFGHDSINRWMLIRFRAERLGVYGLCARCEGSGEIRTGDDRIVLNLWVLHPRKGASRPARVLSIQPHELPDVKRWLAESFRAHASHFSWATAP